LLTSYNVGDRVTHIEGYPGTVLDAPEDGVVQTYRVRWDGKWTSVCSACDIAGKSDVPDPYAEFPYGEGHKRVPEAPVVEQEDSPPADLRTILSRLPLEWKPWPFTAAALNAAENANDDSLEIRYWDERDTIRVPGTVLKYTDGSVELVGNVSANHGRCGCCAWNDEKVVEYADITPLLVKGTQC
jgi:hypothetical protein